MRTTLLTLAVVALAAAGAAAAGSGAAPGAILAALNSERTANGIPGRVKENPSWSEKCASHIAYMGSTGTFGHSEDPASPAYSADGNWAGQNSVLAMGSDWPSGNPFVNAPIHLIQLMSPQLRQVGVEASSGFVCVTTWPGYDSSDWKKPTVFSVPGNGATGVPYAETADELPFVPGDVVGLPRGTRTGFNIMVFAEGVLDPSHLRITAATLTGPRGPVALRTVDRTTSTVGPYLPSGSGFLIPVAPLEPGTTYRASVSFGRSKAQRTWHF
ncbi:MAG: CAP domain-containing protein, partial [Gaiellaceae bacterium]